MTVLAVLLVPLAAGAVEWRAPYSTLERQVLTEEQQAANHSFGTTVLLDGETLLVNNYGYFGGITTFRRGESGWERSGGLEEGRGPLDFRGGTLVVTGWWPSREVRVWRQAEEGDWRMEARLRAPANLTPYSFGHVVAVDGDKLAVKVESTRAIIDGVRYLDTAVLMYERAANGTWMMTDRIDLTDPTSRVPDMELQGSTLVVGADEENVTSPLARRDGSIHVFERNEGGSWEQVAHLRAPGSSYLGGKLALDGDRMVASSYFGGKAFWIFERGAEGWELSQRIDSSGGEQLFFAASLDIVGDAIVAGSPRMERIDYYRTDARGVTQLRQTIDRNGSGDAFGAQVALAGTEIIVGAPGHGAQNTGAAFVFGPRHDLIDVAWDAARTST